MTLPSLRYAALGDSTGVGVGADRGGYPDRLVRRAARQGIPLELLNLCVPGARVSDVLEQQLAAALAAQPAIVTLGIGINDITGGTDPDRFARDYDAVASALAETGAKVVVANVLDLSRLPMVIESGVAGTIRERTAAVNDLISAVVARLGLASVDLFGWSEGVEMESPLISPDRFHPSDAGYEAWADAMEPAFLGASARLLVARPQPS